MTVPSRGRLAAVLAAGMGAGVRRFDGRRGDFEIVAMWKGEELLSSATTGRPSSCER
jgi:hypothetical protein